MRHRIQTPLGLRAQTSYPTGGPLLNEFHEETVYLRTKISSRTPLQEWNTLEYNNSQQFHLESSGFQYILIICHRVVFWPWWFGGSKGQQQRAAGNQNCGHSPHTFSLFDRPFEIGTVPMAPALLVSHCNACLRADGFDLSIQPNPIIWYHMSTYITSHHIIPYHMSCHITSHQILITHLVRFHRV